jgi:ubiquinone biosynthesis protein COQ9
MPNNTYGMRAPVYHAEPIHGENAAWAFPIGGGEIYLPDADQDIIWWIKVDQNGNKQVIPFDVMPHKKTEPVDMDSILSRLNALEERVNGK